MDNGMHSGLVPVNLYNALQVSYGQTPYYYTTGEGNKLNPLEIVEERLKNNKEQIIKLQNEIVELEEAKKVIEENPISIKVIHALRKLGWL